MKTASPYLHQNKNEQLLWAWAASDRLAAAGDVPSEGVALWAPFCHYSGKTSSLALGRKIGVAHTWAYDNRIIEWVRLEGIFQGTGVSEQGHLWLDQVTSNPLIMGALLHYSSHVSGTPCSGSEQQQPSDTNLLPTDAAWWRKVTAALSASHQRGFILPN